MFIGCHPEQWFNAAIVGNAQFIQAHLKTFAKRHDHRSASDTVYPGFTALMYACLNNHDDVFKLLLQQEYEEVTSHTVTINKIKLHQDSTIAHILSATQHTALCDNLVHTMRLVQVSLQKLIGKQNGLGQTATIIGLLNNNLTWACAPNVMHAELFQVTEDRFSPLTLACYCGRVEYLRAFMQIYQKAAAAQSPDLSQMMKML